VDRIVGPILKNVGPFTDQSVRFSLLKTIPFDMFSITLDWTILSDFINKYIPKVVVFFRFICLHNNLYLDYKYHDWHRTETGLDWFPFFFFFWNWTGLKIIHLIWRLNQTTPKNYWTGSNRRFNSFCMLGLYYTGPRSDPVRTGPCRALLVTNNSSDFVEQFQFITTFDLI
jgi:hypothetical protein